MLALSLLILYACLLPTRAQGSWQDLWSKSLVQSHHLAKDTSFWSYYLHKHSELTPAQHAAEAKRLRQVRNRYLRQHRLEPTSLDHRKAPEEPTHALHHLQRLHHLDTKIAFHECQQTGKVLLPPLEHRADPTIRYHNAGCALPKGSQRQYRDDDKAVDRKIWAEKYRNLTPQGHREAADKAHRKSEALISQLSPMDLLLMNRRMETLQDKRKWHLEQIDSHPATANLANKQQEPGKDTAKAKTSSETQHQSSSPDQRPTWKEFLDSASA